MCHRSIYSNVITAIMIVSICSNNNYHENVHKRVLLKNKKVGWSIDHETSNKFIIFVGVGNCIMLTWKHET